MGIAKHLEPAYKPKPGRGSNFRSLFDRGRGTARAHDLVVGRESSIGTAVVSALRGGLAVLIGITSDGGAVSLTVYDGQERQRTYAANPEELEAALDALRNFAAERDEEQEPKPIPGHTGITR